MGSFIAWRGHALMPPTVKAVFAKKGFEEVHELQIGEYHLAYAEKQRMKSPCVYQEASFSLLLMGTAIIPQMPAEDSLKTVVAQYKTEGKIETSRLLGNYLIVLFHADGVQFYTDEANGYSLYFHRHGIWSDSQLAMVHALHSFGEPTSWAYDALNINLSIGFLYGEKTIFKEVYRFDTALHALANEWKYIANARTEEEGMAAPQDAAQAIDLQKETLQGIFKALTPTLRKGGVWCGLTAGLDSRLLALCAHTMAPDVAVKAFTNTQSPHSIQVKIAEQIARALKYDFTVHLHEGVCADIDSNLYFNDGMLRIYQIWLEESKSRASAQNRFATASAVLTGVGGEQYRNSTYTSSRAGEFEDWFRTEFIRRPIGVPFKHKRFESAMIRELKDYVHVRLQTSQHTSWQRSDAEQFMQRIFNPAVRLVRNTIENQISITLSPFTERTAMQAAMLAEPFTREHLSFEVRLIQAISSACDDIPFDYGFAPREAIPARYRRRMWLHRWIPTIATDAMHKWLRKRKARHPSKLMQLPQAEEALQAVRALPLHVDLDALLQNELMAPLVFELGFLILTLNDVVLQDDSIH